MAPCATRRRIVFSDSEQYLAASEIDTYWGVMYVLMRETVIPAHSTAYGLVQTGEPLIGLQMCLCCATSPWHGVPKWRETVVGVEGLEPPTLSL